MYNIQKMNPRHFKVLDLVLDARKNVEIAEELSMTPQAISVIINSPSFQHELALRKGVMDNLRDNTRANEEEPALALLRKSALVAAERLVGNLNHDSATVQNKTACEILDRVGIGKVQKIDATVKSASLIMNADDAKNILETLRMVSV